MENHELLVRIASTYLKLVFFDLPLDFQGSGLTGRHPFFSFLALPDLTGQIRSGQIAWS